MIGITGQMNVPQNIHWCIEKVKPRNCGARQSVARTQRPVASANKIVPEEKKSLFPSCQDIECICLDLLTLTDQHLASLEKISSNLRPAGCRPNCRCRRSRRFCPSCRCLSTEKSLKCHNTRLLFLFCFFPQIRQISDVVPLG